MGCLWPVLPPQASANNFYQALHIACRILGPTGVIAMRYLHLQDFDTDIAFSGTAEPRNQPRVVLRFDRLAMPKTNDPLGGCYPIKRGDLAA